MQKEHVLTINIPGTVISYKCWPRQEDDYMARISFLLKMKTMKMTSL